MTLSAGEHPPVGGPRRESPLVGRVLAGALVGFHVLLPLDIGFPKIPLFGHSLNPAIAASLTVLAVLLVQSRGAILTYLREPYCGIQSAYVGVLVVSAVMSASPLSALHSSVLYACTFIVNYIILRHVTCLDGVRRFSGVVVMLGAAAAAVAVVQGVVGIQLPMYTTWFAEHFGRPPDNYALATARALGTMNNPIVYATLMALFIPFALDLRRVTGRALALFIILFAAGLSGSRTVVLVVGAFAAGALIVYRWRAVRAFPAVCGGLVMLVLALDVSTPGQSSRLSFLVERSGLTDASRRAAGASTAVKLAPGSEEATSASPPTEAELDAALGFSLRRDAAREAIREMTHEWNASTWILGRGPFTAGSVGKRLQPWFNTVDNVFVGVAYERGLLGLVLFIGAFASFLFSTRRAAISTVHWYSPLALAVVGLSFCWDSYSTFNILVVGSMAIAMWYEEQASR